MHQVQSNFARLVTGVAVEMGLESLLDVLLQVLP